MATSAVQRVLFSNRSFVAASRLHETARRRSPFHLFRALDSRRGVLCATSESAEGPVAAAESPPLAALLDIRVGKVLTCERHPEADALYVEQIDVGEEEPRTICSGLVPYVTAESLLEPSVVVLCNLKPRNLRGIKSHGMLLCASDKANDRVAPLVAPPEATIGERASLSEDSLVEAASENQMKKKKIFEAVQPTMKTDDEGIAIVDGKEMRVASGPITCVAIPNAPIS